jgi:hypothetical protein
VFAALLAKSAFSMGLAWHQNPNAARSNSRRSASGSRKSIRHFRVTDRAVKGIRARLLTLFTTGKIARFYGKTGLSVSSFEEVLTPLKSSIVLSIVTVKNRAFSVPSSLAKKGHSTE